ncbi:restriction endonuclease subunit S [Vreelandella jeotgali]|uniref:restriction endonuclease subunit S n=1 Tax=Vreelandella jeotgali TaxID=553386 RepID=UPI000347E825|nr:restriction endonuclease subunit S [Halomonas jeotgali]
MFEHALPGWSRVNLTDLGAYINGYAFKPEDWSEHGLPIVRIAQITGSSADCDYYQGRLSEDVKIDSGDIIFSWSGTLCVVRWNGGPAWLNQHLFKVRPAEGVSHRLLYHVLFHAVAEMDKSAHGSTMKHIKRGELKRYQILFPDCRKEQEKIGRVLDTLDTQIHKTEALITKLEKVKEGLLHDLLTRGIDENGRLRPSPEQAPELYKESPLGLIPREWSCHALTEAADVQRGRFTHRPRNDPAFYGGEYPFIQTGDVAAAKGGGVSYFSQTLSRLGTTASTLFPAQTIAITIAANIADTAILGRPMYFPDSVVGAVVNDSANVRYIELCIRREKRSLDARAPQSAQKNINLQDLRPLLIPFPSQREQNRIAESYEAFMGRLLAERQQMTKLKSEKIALMDDLLTGRVRVTSLLEQAQGTTPA